MSILTAPAATVKPSPADLATMYLRDRGYDAATIQAARYDESVIAPADAASVQRIIRDACTPAPAVLADRHTAEGVTEAAHAGAVSLRDVRDAHTYYGANFALLAPAGILDKPGEGWTTAEIEATTVDRLVRDGAASRVTFATKLEPTLPTYSDDAEVESAIGEARACLYPASENYRTNMRALADMADRSAALLDDVVAYRTNVIGPAPVSPIGDTSARCPECGTRTDDGPCVICDGWFAPAFGLSPAPFAFPAPICGGSHNAEPVTFETRCEGGAWVVTRDGRTAFRSRFMVSARADMRTRAQAEADRDGVSVVALFHQPGRPVVGQTFDPRQTRPALLDAHAPADRSAAAYMIPPAVARSIARTRTGGHHA